MRHRGWAVLLLVPAALDAGAPRQSGDVLSFALGVRQSGVDRGAVWWSLASTIAWAVVGTVLAMVALRHWVPVRRRRGWWTAAPIVLAAAGILGVARSVLVLVERPAAGAASAGWARDVLASITWWSLMADLVAAVALVGVVVGPASSPVVRPVLHRLFGRFDAMAGTHPSFDPSFAPSGPPSDEAVPASGSHHVTQGIAVSGGGIRSAAIAIGALRRLDEARSDGPSLFMRSRWISAVSGGCYTSGGWRISRRPGAHVGADATADHDGLFDRASAWSDSVARRHRFLDNGRLAIFGGLANALARTVAVLGAVVSATVLAGWGVGRLVRSTAVHPDFVLLAQHPTGSTLHHLLPARLTVPWLVPGALAAVLAAVAFATADHARRNRLLRFAGVAVAAALAGALLTIGAPFGIVYGRRLLADLTASSSTKADRGAGLLGLLSALGVIGALVGLVTAQVKRHWLRLGGVALAVAMFLVAGKVADSAAAHPGGAWCSGLLVGVAAAWLLVVDAIASHRLTLGGLYRKRIATTFALDGDDVDSPPHPIAYSNEPPWPAYEGALGPELIVAATAHSTRRTFTGVTAYGFTFRPSRFTLHDRTDGTSAAVPAGQFPSGGWWEGYPRGWLVSRAMALTGGAIASAMGREALGTTQALLVALNLRLGAWVPNPRHADWFLDTTTAPRVHLGYLAKELFGRYHPDRDAFVYVADGGHRENLGLVELLRERPDVAISIDGAGDTPGTFATVRQAIAMAEVELDVHIELDLEPVLLPATSATTPEDLPADCVAVGAIHYPATMGGGTGRLVFAKAQLDAQSPVELLRYATVDPRFPNYPLTSQYLTDVQFANLVALGEHLGARLVARLEGG